MHTPSSSNVCLFLLLYRIWKRVFLDDYVSEFLSPAMKEAEKKLRAKHELVFEMWCLDVLPLILSPTLCLHLHEAVVFLRSLHVCFSLDPMTETFSIFATTTGKIRGSSLVPGTVRLRFFHCNWMLILTEENRKKIVLTERSKSFYSGFDIFARAQQKRNYCMKLQ